MLIWYPRHLPILPPRRWRIPRLLLLHPIGNGRTVVNRTDPVRLSCTERIRLGRGGLACAMWAMIPILRYCSIGYWRAIQNL
jgi:hypothetical protein